MLELPVTGFGVRELGEAVRRLIHGQGNYVFTVTLTASATTTTLTSKYISAKASVLLSPTTSNAAAALATTYASTIAAGSVTLTHANNAQVDRTFRVAVMGG